MNSSFTIQNSGDKKSQLAHMICSLTFHGCDSKLFSLMDKHQTQIDEACVDSQGYSPLHYAAVGDNVNLVSGLCARAPRLMSARDRNGDTPLHAATQANNVAAVQTLLEAGAGASVANYRGVAPIHMAAVQGCPEVLQMMLDAGTFVGVADAQDASSMHWVAVSESEQEATTSACVSLLMERGADIDATDNEQETPLHWAARECNAVAVRALLDAGANPSIMNESGETAVHIANFARSSVEAGGGSDAQVAQAQRCVELLADATRRYIEQAGKKGMSVDSGPQPMFTVVI